MLNVKGLDWICVKWKRNAADECSSIEAQREACDVAGIQNSPDFELKFRRSALYDFIFTPHVSKFPVHWTYWRMHKLEKLGKSVKCQNIMKPWWSSCESVKVSNSLVFSLAMSSLNTNTEDELLWLLFPDPSPLPQLWVGPCRPWDKNRLHLFYRENFPFLNTRKFNTSFSKNCLHLSHPEHLPCLNVRKLNTNYGKRLLCWSTRWKSLGSHNFYMTRRQKVGSHYVLKKLIITAACFFHFLNT